jgi:nifR3 family TIM-barrel protein
MPSYRDFLSSHRVMLAPLAGVSDRSMRQLCIEQGAQLTFTEMVSAKGLSYGNERTEDLLEMAPNEDIVGVQIFGHEPEVMAGQAARLCETVGEKLAVIDINMGCPVRKLVTKGDGSALMKSPELAERIVSAVVAASSVPVTVKFRRGYEIDNETAPEFARRMEQAGACAVTVHGRYAAQMYHGQADWGVIERVVRSVSIPVVGNGDVVSGASALAMMEQTGCEAVLVARAARGNPWVFAEIRAALEGRPAPEEPTPLQRVEMARRHAHLLYEWEPRALVRMRKQGSWYCKGLDGASAARGMLNACKTIEEYDRAFDRLEQHLKGC